MRPPDLQSLGCADGAASKRRENSKQVSLMHRLELLAGRLVGSVAC